MIRFLFHGQMTWMLTVLAPERPCAQTGGAQAAALKQSHSNGLKRLRKLLYF